MIVGNVWFKKKKNMFESIKDSNVTIQNKFKMIHIPNVVNYCPIHVTSFPTWNLTEGYAMAPSSVQQENTPTYNSTL